MSESVVEGKCKLSTENGDGCSKHVFNGVPHVMFLTDTNCSNTNSAVLETTEEAGSNNKEDLYAHLSFRTEGKDLVRLTDNSKCDGNSTDCRNGDIVEEGEDFLANVRESELTYREYCVRNKGETSSEVTCIATTRHDCQMIVCDHLNGTINLVDKQFNVVFKYHSCFKAFGVAVLDASFFVVTFPLVRLMQYYKFKDSFSKFAPWFPVKAQNEYYGVCGTGDRIVAVCKYDGDNRKDTPSVHILNRQGNVLSIITKDANGKQLFVDPEFIAINNASRAVYVSDSGAGAIVCLSLAGEVLSIFSSRNFLPTGIAIDDSIGVVYVNDVHSESVISFNRELEAVQKIKAQREKLTALLCATYCIKSDRLILSMKKSFYLKAFTL